MVLAEISNNIPGRARTVGRSTQSSSNGICHTSHWAERKADFKPPPSSLQSMLKTTTETGDVGQLSVRPSRIPYPTTRRVSQRREDYYIHASPTFATRAISEQQPGQHRDSEYISGEYNHFRPYAGATASSVISLYESESQQSSDCLSERANQDYQSYPVTHSSRTSYKVSDPRSLASLRVQRKLTRSPLAYPTRLKRPGYRPSSPSLGDFSGSEARTNSGLDRGIMSRTCSPLSMHGNDREPLDHRRGFSRSIPTHVNSPSAFIRRLDRAQESAPTRVSTPTPLSQQSASAATQDQWAQSVLSLPICSRQSPPATPLYYDYTEAFEEESHFRNTTVSMDSPVDRPIPEDRPVHHGLDAKVEGNPIELPVCGGASPDSFVGSTYSANGNLPKEGTGGTRMQAVENRAVEISPSAEACLSECRSHPPGPSDDVDEDESEQKPPTVFEISKQLGSIGCSSFPDDHCAGTIPSPVSEYAARGLVSSNSFSQSSHPSCTAMHSMEYYFSTAEGARKENPDVEEGSQVQWKIPSLDFSHLDLHDKTTCTFGPCRPRALSPDGLVETDHAGIYAPVPERILPSRSHQNKYSRILSIDENFSELAELVAKSEIADTIRAPDLIGDDSRPVEAVHNSQGSSSSIRSVSVLAGQYSAPTGSLADTNLVTLRESDGDQQRALSELIRQSLLWEDSRSTASSGQTRSTNDGMVPEQLLQDYFSEAPARNSSQPSPVLTRDPAIASTPQKILISQHSGRSELAKKASHAESMKSLPPLPTKSSLRPSMHPNPSSSIKLSCTFRPVNTGREDTLTANMERPLGALPEQGHHDGEEKESIVRKYKLKMRPNRGSTDSPADSRPWNFDASYPWSTQPTEVALRLPEPSRLHQQPVAKSPRFKLKITRASFLSEGTIRIKTQATSPKAGTSQQASKPIDLFQSLTFKRRGKSGLSDIGTGSHGSLSKKMRLNEALDGRLSMSGNSSLIPPLPVPQSNEARSFFSDDSSQKFRKGSLRKRLSYLKAIATRASSSEEEKGVDRGLAGSAMGKSGVSGRSSQHSTGGATVGMSNLKYVRWKMVERIKVWWQRGEEKIRAFGELVKGKSHKSRSQNTELYQGI
ncbi:MAG: hypothetical protein LQ347_000904 [Umbilicaria vellea]|nr:MAG: hypothetical protein LQ347_000904 [Umbilicaria vellea]